MKSIFGRSLVIACLARAAIGGFCLAADGGGKTEAAPSSVPPAAQRIEFPPEDVENRSIENYLGLAVRGANDQYLGEVRDFLVDERTSRLAFAVVASGGVLGFGDTLRLVPIRALTPAGDRSKFTVNLTEAQWREMLTLSEKDFEQDRIAVTGKDPEKRESFERDTTATSTPVAPESSDLDQRLMRVSTLAGRDVTVAQLDVGEIEDVVLDFNAGTVRALLDPEREFAGTADKVLVPLGKFIFAERGERLVGTLLTRSDFNDLYRSWNQTTGPRQPPAVAERHRQKREELKPTGRNGAATSGPADRESLVRAAEAVRKMLRSDSEFEAAEVHVVPENGRLILRGAARDAAQKQAIEKEANDAAGRVPIENEIRIKTR